jgi:uncharacterized protein involved in exopolysaccharide biosynthesis
MNNTTEHEYMVEEDEIDLRELWQTIKNGKKVIFLTVVIIVTLTLFFVLKMPNVYKSDAILIPVESDKSSLGSLGGLAAMAGISIGGGGSMTPDVAFNSLLNDYSFMKNFVIKNKIVQHYSNNDVDKNYVFALGYRGLYDLLKSDTNNKDMQQKIYDTVKRLKSNLSISSDKKTGLITVAYMDSDRAYAPEIVNAFLKDASKYLVDNNLEIIDNKLKYFQKEMKEVESFELRKNMSAMISNILQEKVVTQSKKYYKCDVLTKPSVSYIKDKAKPKRGLILVVAFITSIILGIFLVFFLEFIRNSKKEEKAI